MRGHACTFFAHSRTVIHTCSSTVIRVFGRPCGQVLGTQNASGYFIFWISLSLRPKTETKRLNF